jgi:site-specific recombinase XerD
MPSRDAVYTGVASFTAADSQFGPRSCICSRDSVNVLQHIYEHLFAIHTLRRWCRGGDDLEAKLPLLATYLGHQNLFGTQRYLHLTAELFPEITA